MTKSLNKKQDAKKTKIVLTSQITLCFGNQHFFDKIDLAQQAFSRI
jgi:hypothetical protein